MDRSEALDRMEEIRRIAERTTLYTVLPGVPSVVGGLIALAGCAASFGLIGSLDFRDILQKPVSTQIGFCVLWTALGAAAIAQDVILTSRAAARSGVGASTRPGRFAALSLSPSVLVAVVLTVQFLVDLRVEYIAPVWMMCYGTGVYAAGLFSVRLPRVLGLAFIAAGTATLLFLPSLGVAATAVSFGLFHILFGLEVARRAAKDAADA